MTLPSTMPRVASSGSDTCLHGQRLRPQCVEPAGRTDRPGGRLGPAPPAQRRTATTARRPPWSAPTAAMESNGTSGNDVVVGLGSTRRDRRPRRQRHHRRLGQRRDRWRLGQGLHRRSAAVMTRSTASPTPTASAAAAAGRAQRRQWRRQDQRPTGLTPLVARGDHASGGVPAGTPPLCCVRDSHVNSPSTTFPRERCGGRQSLIDTSPEDSSLIDPGTGVGFGRRPAWG